MLPSASRSTFASERTPFSAAAMANGSDLEVLGAAASDDDAEASFFSVPPVGVFSRARRPSRR